MAVYSGIQMLRAHPVIAARLAIGLGQGLLLYVLFRAVDIRAWPVTVPTLFEALLVCAAFVPLVLLQGLTHLRPRPLATWTIGAAVLLAGLGGYDGYRLGASVLSDASYQFAACTAGALFVAQTLIIAGAVDGKRIASYPTYFDTAWKHGVQVVAAIGFTVVFWILLQLGASLFKLIDIQFFAKLIEHRWFSMPATALAVAAAIHVTDVRPTLVRGIRTLALTLLSWLLPLLTVIVAGFLVSLPLTGLQPLWNTKFATSLLLAVSAALVAFTNAAYQDGTPETANALLRRVVKIASVLPAPIVGIAVYALALRVDQYGWTTDRVVAGACIVVAACYAVGYLASALRPGASSRVFERCNVAASFVALGVLFALFTPVADPMRVGTNSQLARLKSGAVPVEKFDFKFLRFDAGRYGRVALEKLESGEIKIAGAQEYADNALQLKTRNERAAPTIAQVAANIMPMRAGQEIPPGFLRQNWHELMKTQSYAYPPCLSGGGAPCEALLADLDDDGVNELLLFGNGFAAPSVFKASGGESWMFAGTLPPRLACDDMRALLRAGEFHTISAPWRNIEIGGLRLQMSEQRPSPACPPKQ